MKIIKLIKTSAFATLMSLSSSGLNLALSLLLARQYSIDLFAQYSYIMSLISLSTIAITLGLPRYILLERIGFGNPSKIKIIKLIMNICYFILAFFIFIYLMFLEKEISEILFVLASIYFASRLMIRQSLLVVDGNILLSNIFDKVARVLFLLTAYYFFYFTGLVFDNLVVIVILFSYIFIELVYLLFFNIKVDSIDSSTIDLYKVKNLFHETSKLFIVGVLVTVVTNLDILYLGHIQRAEDIALVASSQKISLVGNLFLVTLTMITTPLLATMSIDKSTDLRRYNYSIAIIGFISMFVFSIIVFTFRFELLGLFGDEFKLGAELLTVYLVAICSSAVFGQSLTMMKVKKQYSIIICILLLSILFKIILMVILYSRLGVIGVGYSNLFCILLWNILMATWLKIKFNINTTIIKFGN